MVGLSRAARALLLCLVTASAAVATPKETHKRGLEAIGAGRWQDAARFFREAIAERPQEKVRALGADYLPHYYLGVAWSELERCRSALDAWKESTRQGQIQKSDLDGELHRRKKLCQDQLQRIEAAKREVEEVLSRGGEAAAALTGLSATPELAPLWNQGSPSFGSRQQRAESQLATARGRLVADGDGDSDSDELRRLGEAASLAEAALAELRATHEGARRRLGELNAATATALEQLDVVVEGARELLRSVSGLAPYSRRLGSRVAAVDRFLKEVDANRSAASPERLNELADELTGAMSALRRVARRPPRELAQAVEAYLKGSYQEALALLDDDRLAGGTRSKPYVCLLKAASHHDLWVLGGERDDALRDLAIAAITGCVEKTPSDEPPSLPVSSTIFSPRFVDFYDTAREADARSAELEASTGEQEADAEPTAGDSEPAGSGPSEG